MTSDAPAAEVPSPLLRRRRALRLFTRENAPHIRAMPKPPRKPSKPSRAKASRPDVTPLDEHLSALLNPALSPSPARGFGEAPQASFVSDGPMGLVGAPATVELLKALLELGDPNLREKSPWTPHRPARPEKSEGGVKFEIVSEYEPKGDQPQAIKELVAAIDEGERDQVLLGVTGSGKTFTMAQVIEKTQRPALILAPNKTLAAQLYGEFKSFFPNNAVEYFVSYYDYYQPEAYVPRTDTYIEKEIVDQRADRSHAPCRHARAAGAGRCDHRRFRVVHLRHRLGRDLHRHDVLDRAGEKLDQRQLIADLVALQYKRSGGDFARGIFRVRGDTIEIFPAHYEDRAWRVGFFGDEVESISEFDPLTGKKTHDLELVKIYANSHYVTPRPTLLQAVDSIKKELKQRLPELYDFRPPAGGAAARAAHDVRSRNARSHRFLRRHRKLFALSHGPPPRRAAADPVRIPARQRARLHRRKPCHRAADRRHV